MKTLAEMSERFRTLDRFARHCGIELVEISEGRATARMPIRAEHRNTLEMCHGGAIFTLADYAFAAASNSRGEEAVSITASISFLKAGLEGTLTAEAFEESPGRKVRTYTVRVCNDAGDPVALFQGTVYRKKPE